MPTHELFSCDSDRSRSGPSPPTAHRRFDEQVSRGQEIPGKLQKLLELGEVCIIAPTGMTDTDYGGVPIPLPEQAFMLRFQGRVASACRMDGCVISAADSSNRWLSGYAARPICKFRWLARGSPRRHR